MTTKELDLKEYDSYYGRYISKLKENISLLDSFQLGKENVINFFDNIPENKHHYQYAENKWNCLEILQHLVDTERIFMYRCFRIARNDNTPLAGFDQNIYIEPSGANKKKMAELLTEFQFTRDSSICLLQSMNNVNLRHIGNANSTPMSARAAAFTITGHEIWHMDILKERYL